MHDNESTTHDPLVPAELSQAEKKRGQKYAMITNAGAGFAIQCITGPLMLLYCNDALGFSATQIGLISAIIPLSSLIKLPFLNVLQSYKKLKVLRLAHFFRLLAVIAIILIPEAQQSFATFVAILLFYLTAFEFGTRSMWQPLMRDITSTSDRGRFFARLRFIFTLVSTGCTAVVPFIVGSDLSGPEYKSILLFVAVLLINQLFWSKKIPELIHPAESSLTKSFASLIQDLRASEVMRWPLLAALLIQCQSIPLFIIYAKKSLGIPTHLISTYAFLVSLGSLISMLYWGKKNDINGYVPLLRNIMLMTILFAPIAIILSPASVLVNGEQDSFASPFKESTANLVMLALFLTFGFLKGIILAGGGLATTTLMHFHTPSRLSVSLMPIFLTIVMLGWAFFNLCSGWLLEYTLMHDNSVINPFRVWLFICYVINPVCVLLLLKKLKNSH